MRILIATSGPPYSDVQLGAEIARCTDRSPTVLTVIGDEGERPQANAILAHACELLSPQVQEGQTRIRVGHPAEEIVREAEEGNYDLVIVADKQHHGWVTRFFLGSTAQRVVEYAPCPVIVAKGKIGPIRRILLCDSGADSSVLINHTAQLADLIGGEIEATVLHVMSQMSAGPGVVGKQLRASTEELLQQDSPEGELLSRDIRMLDGLNLLPRPKVRHGLVVDEVLAEAKGQDYDLIVIGAHRGEGWHRILLDDLARQIIEKAGRPVFVAK
jgi:nucleotide-binding universal stress UspA family protein